MVAAMAAAEQRFVRRTSLNPDEYRSRFRQIDCDVIEALTSDEASRVTSQMSKIYLRLINVPSKLWEREGVLRCVGEDREGKWQTAWEQLIALTGVASATARKALDWMSKQGIIGYHAGRNGVGIRIFINRAASSIGQRPQGGQKNLRLVRASSGATHTSPNEAPFKDSSAILENLDLNIDPHTPENSAREIKRRDKTSNHLLLSAATNTTASSETPIPRTSEIHTTAVISSTAIAAEIAKQIAPQVRAAIAHEHERMREWFATHALPKAIRVAHHSAYDVLRAYGLISKSGPRSQGYTRADDREVEKYITTEANPRPLTEEEITEIAESCVALLVTQGRSIEHTTSELSMEAGGFLLAKDVSKVRMRAESLDLCKRS